MSRGSDSVPRMTQIDRRRLLALGAGSLALPAAIERAVAIDAKSETGTIQDVAHIVILVQENRSFDHYFGTMRGVRGFGDRFALRCQVGGRRGRRSTRRPRMPMYVVSPFSRGGFVNSEVFDHPSVIRYCEKRFGVIEPNISAWRRAVCGDLTSCFDFKSPNAAITALPKTLETAQRAATLDKRTAPPTPGTVTPQVQASGVWRARALPYACDVALTAGRAAKLDFINRGSSGAVFHVYDLKRPDAAPRRYTVEALKTLTGAWPDGAYDLFVVGPNRFHLRYRGEEASVSMSFAAIGRKARLRLSNASGRTQHVTAVSAAYQEKIPAMHAVGIPRGEERDFVWDFAPTSGWYDLKVMTGDFEQRLAGRLDDGSPTTSDPAMGGSALMAWS